MKRTLALVALLFGLATASANADVIVLQKKQLRFQTSAAATVGIFTDSLTFTQNAANAQDTAYVDISDILRPAAGTVTTDSTLWLRIVLERADGVIGSTTLGFSDDSQYVYIRPLAAGTPSGTSGPSIIAMPTGMQAPGVDSGLGSAELNSGPGASSQWQWSISWGRLLAAAGGADLRQARAVAITFRGDSSAANTGEFQGFVEYLVQR